MTGTALAHIKRLELWPEFVDHLAKSKTIRQSAGSLGVHVSTIFRWRHTALRAIRSSDQALLRGLVEVGELGLLYSEKGSRTLRRAARQRGIWQLAEGLCARRVCVTVACDRNGSVFSSLVPYAHPLMHDLRDGILTRVAAGATVIASYAKYSPYATATRSRGHTFQFAPRFGVSADDTYHTLTMQRYAKLFERWLLGFRGVATRYLENYLAWHRCLHMTDYDRIGKAISRALYCCFS